MRLVKNAGEIARRSHSMRAFYLSLLALLTPELLFLLLGYDVVSPRLWWLIGVALLIYGIVGRLVDQRIGDER